MDGDLANTTDWRLVLGEILDERCGLGVVNDVFAGLRWDGADVPEAIEQDDLDVLGVGTGPGSS